jgi:putative peptidoglycan lipid II flippase
MSKMLKSSGAMAAATMMSRVLGMVREIVYSWFMGVGMVAGAFQLAFQIPNLFRRLLGEGALTASFIPIFKEKEKTSTKEEMWAAANAVISGLVVVATVIVVLVMLGISAVLALGPYEKPHEPGFSAADIKDLSSLTEKLKTGSRPVMGFLWQHLSEPTRQAATAYDNSRAHGKELKTLLAQDLTRIIQSGPIYDQTLFPDKKLSPETRKLLTQPLAPAQLAALNQLLIEDTCQPEITNHFKETGLMLRLLRVMFPYMLLICLTAVFMGMLNALGHFFIPASGALVMNVVMIASVFWLAPHMGESLNQRIFALAIGVLVAGVAQALFQLPPLRGEGFRYRWVTPWNDPTVRRVVRQMIPGAIGIAAFQINILTTQGVAFWVDPSMVAKFNVAVRLMELPQGVFGVSLATYLLPTLSGLAAERKFKEFRATLNHGVDHLFYLNSIATVLLVLLAEPIIRLLFQHGRFLPEDTPKVAYALMALAPGLVAFSMVNIFGRAFYALGDTKTPMKISILCLMLNLVFSLAFVWRFRQAGLAAANTLSAGFNLFFLVRCLKGKLGELEFDSLKRVLFKTLAALVLAGAATWAISSQWETRFGHVGIWRQLVAVFLPMTVATAIYGALTLWWKVPAATEIGGLMLERLGKATAKP